MGHASDLHTQFLSINLNIKEAQRLGPDALSVCESECYFIFEQYLTPSSNNLPQNIRILISGKLNNENHTSVLCY